MIEGKYVGQGEGDGSNIWKVIYWFNYLGYIEGFQEYVFFFVVVLEREIFLFVLIVSSS